MASLQLSAFSRGELQTRVGLGCPPVQYGFLSGWLLSTSHPRAEDPSALMGGGASEEVCLSLGILPKGSQNRALSSRKSAFQVTQWLQSRTLLMLQALCSHRNLPAAHSCLISSNCSLPGLWFLPPLSRVSCRRWERALSQLCPLSFG